MNTEPNPENAIPRFNLDADDFEQRRQIDRLVSGDLAQVERVQLLAWLDEVPARWRRCGLAFLEVQTLSQALQALPDEESGAPRLDDQSSADLIARLQAEAAPLSTPTRTRRSPLAIGLVVAAAAVLVVAVIWISNLVSPGANHEVAHRTKTDSDPSARPAESTDIEERVTSFSLDNASLDNLSATDGDSASESAALSLAASADPSLAAYNLEPRQESLVNPNHHREWQNVSAMAAHADMLYVVDSGHLYEVGPIDGSRRFVGDDDWQNTAAMGAANGHLYIVSDNQLYEVSPTSGARRSLGKPDWAETEAIVTVGDKVYIVAGGLLHRVNPNDGSHEVLHDKDDSTNDPRKPKH